MKALHIIRSLDPTGGGPVEAVTQLGLVMAEAGHITEVVTLDPPDARWLNACPFKTHVLGPAAGSYGYTPRLVPWLVNNAAAYDAVIINGLWQYHGFGTWKALHGRIPYCVFVHGMLDPWFKREYPLKHIKKWLYWPWAEYRVLRDAGAVLFTCDEERRLARKSFWLYDCHEAVVNLGIAEPPYEPDVQVASFLQQYPFLAGKRIALFMGRLHPKKGCDLLLRAFAQVLASDPCWYLVMAGPDQIGWRSELEALAESLGIRERTICTGMVSGELKWGALRAAEVFVLPSHQENFGIAVAEALACGLPVLISNQVNIWRELEEDCAGLVADDNLSGASRLLRSWIEMSDRERTTMRSRARLCFDRNFNIREPMQRFMRVVSQARN